MQIRPITASDREWAGQALSKTFASPRIVSRGVVHDGNVLPGLVAEHEGGRTGLLLYRMADRQCEVVVLLSLHERKGAGTALLEEVEMIALQAECNRLWLVTTNDNLEAIEFYRRRGWRQVAVHRGAIAAARRLKPEIPELGPNGIPMEDEIEFERTLPS